MKKIALSILFLSAGILAHGQDVLPQKPKKGLGFGIKVGSNFANVSNVSSVNNSSRAGFMVGAFLSPNFSGKKIFGYRSELIYSQQGYDFKNQTATGSVRLNYLALPQMMTINLTKFVQLQAGGQISFLINASEKFDKPTTAVDAYNKAMDYYNRFDYGFAGGVEIHPYKGVFFGGRYNLSFQKANKDYTDIKSLIIPPYIPPAGTNFKNNLVNFFVGYKF